MSNKQPTTDATMPDRLYGGHYPDSFLDVPRPIRESNVATLGDYIRHLQEVDKQSDKPCVACEPVESSFDHICPNNPILTCNCTDPKFCAELGNDPDRQYRDPDDGDKDGFADNIDYTGIPIPAPKRQDTLVGWPCVVVGAFSETWTTAAERVPGSEHSAGHTEQRTDAGFDNDGPAATTKL
jgi:hypothetical protein